MKNLFGFGSGWRQVTGNANYKHEYIFYYLMISPSYWLAHRQVHLNESIPESELPDDFDDVLTMYKKLGDVYSKHFIEWWDQTGKDLFAEKNTKDRILISIDPTKPKQELLEDFMELLAKLDSREKKTPSEKIHLQVNKIRLSSLHNRYQLVLAKAEFFQNKIKKEQLWRLAKYIGINSTKTKEIRLNSKKTSANLETRTYLSILASKNLSDALCIAENAARGKFPSLEPIKNSLKFDYVTIKKQQDLYAKRTWDLLLAEEKNKKDYGKILSPSKSSRKIKDVNENEMLET
ncbi:hypothetical protein MCERHM31_00103 [Methylophilaceae bacterium]